MSAFTSPIAQIVATTVGRKVAITLWDPNVVYNGNRNFSAMFNPISGAVDLNGEDAELALLSIAPSASGREAPDPAWASPVYAATSPAYSEIVYVSYSPLPYVPTSPPAYVPTSPPGYCAASQEPEEPEESEEPEEQASGSCPNYSCNYDYSSGSPVYAPTCPSYFSDDSEDEEPSTKRHRSNTPVVMEVLDCHQTVAMSLQKATLAGQVIELD